MENMLDDVESLPDLFSDTGNEIDFVHSTSSESSDDSFIQSLSNWTKKKRRLKHKEVPLPKPNEPNQTNIDNYETSA
ncbi:hypothetical protein AVEN_155496-1 [Araneus ventricosus]|uniref:Uncharacterized protein n=1 Tax=Araneus ventricosus TaxID=182803 RepID=A0A4Y2X571_ARAVE|nr:hypothetical protein AVEN_269082-1 [Araneus ventricosus]GBO43274.1 hypothetical protein AVEN_51412-1 [Araneus ventricosus]GBO43277.1 hypothetical protein AVEN_79393-1 [Araneus ventricosus]GBO43282.1 hypothetical protein AVEN_155496-1 [Araneus ventricosus]